MSEKIVYAVFKKIKTSQWEFLFDEKNEKIANKKRDTFDKLNPNIITRIDAVVVR